MKWISVSEDLPNNDELVIVTNIEDQDDKWVCCGYLHKNHKWYNQFEEPYWDADIRPTHWMPLPKPPRK